jgi:hypothetical protein
MESVYNNACNKLIRFIVILSTKLQQNKGVEMLVVFAVEAWPEVNMYREESTQASRNGKGRHFFSLNSY